MPRLLKARRVGRKEIDSWKQTLYGLKNRTGQYLMQLSLGEALAYLRGRTTSEKLWRDEFREWLAHGFDLDCQCVWEYLALHLVSRSKTKYKRIRWSPDLTLRVVKLATYKEAMRKVGRSEARQVRAIGRLCDLMTAFLDWRLNVSPAEWRRFRRAHLRVGPPR